MIKLDENVHRATTLLPWPKDFVARMLTRHLLAVDNRSIITSIVLYDV